MRYSLARVSVIKPDWFAKSSFLSLSDWVSLASILILGFFEINLSTACVSFDLSIGYKYESFNQSKKLFCSEISIESEILEKVHGKVS